MKAVEFEEEEVLVNESLLKDLKLFYSGKTLTTIDGRRRTDIEVRDLLKNIKNKYTACSCKESPREISSSQRSNFSNKLKNLRGMAREMHEEVWNYKLKTQSRSEHEKLFLDQSLFSVNRKLKLNKL